MNPIWFQIGKTEYNAKQNENKEHRTESCNIYFCCLQKYISDTTLETICPWRSFVKPINGF